MADERGGQNGGRSVTEQPKRKRGRPSNAERARLAAEEMTRLEQPDYEGLLELAANAATNDPDSEADFHDIGKAAIREMSRRMNNPVEVMDIPAQHLMKLAADYQRITAGVQAEEAKIELNTVQMIVDAGIPDERKLELLKSERDRGFKLVDEAVRAIAQYEKHDIVPESTDSE